MSDHDHAGDHSHEFHSHAKLYFGIFAALCVFTVISVLADVLHMPNKALLIGIVLAVAVCKALCVLLVFMHLQFERAWKYLLLAPTIILACTVPFALAPDIGFHYYTVDSPQVYEHERLEALKKSGHVPAKGGHH